MGRPKKAIVDYFPHFCTHGRVLFVMQSIWKNDGYSAFYKLYELMGNSEGHAYDCKKDGNWEYLVTYFMVDEETAHAMIRKLCSLGIVDSDLWYQGLVLWSDCFIEDLDAVYSRRKIDCPAKPDLCQHKPYSGVQAATENPPQEESGHKNPQSKVKESKVKEKNTLAPTYNFDTHQWENIDGHLNIWHKAFPALDIRAQLDQMASWLEANPRNKKSNYSRFIHNWLARSQDKAPRDPEGNRLW
jgi:hypothetical protein